MTYLKAVLIAADQLVNALLAGWPDETMSSRAWRWEQDGVRAWPRRVIDRLFWWEPNHCRESYESERTRRQLPPELRTG
ncbi:pseudouridine synthase [uncultured Mailhella sp.]|uniref:pseudouridine synthase n=1 Tax=uncultured Mailhella sp. TaxID=1981031 RepID=UPI0025E80033|nr:pseudouridine synthase [uncultured Mailhella sp.]